MGYLFLSFALLSGAIKGFCGKKTSGYVTDFRDTLLLNLFRMVLCIGIGLGILFLQSGISELVPDIRLLLLSSLAGVMTSAFVASWLYSVKQNAYMLVEIFLMLGVVVTVVMSFIVYGEPVGIRDMLGLCILFAAVILMCAQGKRPGIVTVIVLLVCGISNGLADFSQKIYVNSVGDASVAAFQFYTYCFSAVTLLVLFLILKPKGLDGKNDGGAFKALKGSFGYILVMAVCLYANSYFKTEAAAHLSATQLYPLNQGGGLLLSTLMASLFFKEKMTVRSLCGIVLAFVALLLINL